MTFHRRQFLHLAVGGVALPAFSHSAWAQAYPGRPVHLIVAFPAGSAPDIIARLAGQHLSERLGQQFVIENRPGFGGNIATEFVARAAPDGYTILMPVSTNAVNATLYPNLSFNFMRDIAPIAGIAKSPFVVVVPASFPPRTLPEFIAHAPGQSGQDQYGLGRQRQLAPCFRRTVPDHDRDQNGSRPVSRQLHGRFARGSGAGRIQSHCASSPAHPRQQAARPCGDH